MRLCFKSRSDNTTGTVQPPFPVQVRRYSWDVYGGPRELEAVVEFPGGTNLAALWGLVPYLRCGVECYDDRGAIVWWGYVDKITVNDGTRSFGIALDNMFNRVRATYELLLAGGTTGLRADTPWVEDTISSGIYGVKEKNYSMTSYSVAAAIADTVTRLAASKYPTAITELASVTDRAVTVELLCAGWWKTLSWLYYDNASTAYETVANQLIDMANTGEFVTRADMRNAATTLAPEYRNGDELLMDEIEKLLETGTDDDRRILCLVDKYIQVHFYAQPAKVPTSFATEQYFLDLNNNLFNSMGGKIEPSACKVGVWAHLRNYELIQNFQAITSPTPVFIERAIYDVEAGQYQPESYGYKSPFDELQGIQR